MSKNVYTMTSNYFTAQHIQRSELQLHERVGVLFHEYKIRFKRIYNRLLNRSSDMVINALDL